MLMVKENIIRYELSISTDNPFYKSCKSHIETKMDACGVVEAIKWEFEQAGQTEAYTKMINTHRWQFRFIDASAFGRLNYLVEYVTKTKDLY